MTNDIKKYVKNCTVCEKTKVITNTSVPMEISSMGEVLFDHTFIDFVGPIQPSEGGHKYIFTAICDLTKFLIAVPTNDCTALSTAECLLENVICRYNFPSRIISDNATSFTSRVIRDITRLFHIKKIFITAYHSQSNSVERAHRSLNAYMRAFTAKNRNSWHDLLKFATFAYNNSIHSTTGFTPYELAHGFRIQIPTNLTKPKVVYNYENLADQTRNNIAKALEIACEHLYLKKLQNKKYYDKNAKPYVILPGDSVLVKSQVKNHKFQDVYEGPYTVTDTSDSYIEILRNNIKVKIHKNLVKKTRTDNDKNAQTPTADLGNLDDEHVLLIKLVYDIEMAQNNGSNPPQNNLKH